MSIDYGRLETAATGSETTESDDLTIRGRCAGSGGNSPTLQTTGTRKTGAEPSADFTGGRSVPAERKVEPRVRQRCRLLINSCINSASRALDTPEDYFVRYNALEQLKDSLAELWSWRDKREEPFAEVVNVLQGRLLGKGAENFEPAEIAALKTVFLRLHDEPVITRLVVNDVVTSLMEDGIDVFLPIA